MHVLLIRRMLYCSVHRRGNKNGKWDITFLRTLSVCPLPELVWSHLFFVNGELNIAYLDLV